MKNNIPDQQMEQGKQGSGETGRMTEGLIPQCKEGKWGFVNSRSETVIPFVYSSAKNFRNGVALVTDEEGNRIMIDHQNRPVSDSAYKYVDKGDRPRYNKKHLNSNFTFRNTLPSGVKIYKTKYGTRCEAAFLPESKRFVLDKLYHAVRDAGGNYLKAAIRSEEDEEIKWGVFDMNGDQILPVIFDDVSWAGGNCFAFRAGNKWGVVSSGLEVLLDPVLPDAPVAESGPIKNEKTSTLLVRKEDTESPLGDWIAGRLIDFGFKPASFGGYSAFYDPSGAINFHAYEIFDEKRVMHNENRDLSDELRQKALAAMEDDSEGFDMTPRFQTTDNVELFADDTENHGINDVFMINSLFGEYDPPTTDLYPKLSDPDVWMASQQVKRMPEELHSPDFEDMEEDYAFFGMSLNDGEFYDEEWVELDEDGNPVSEDDERWEEEDDDGYVYEFSRKEDIDFEAIMREVEEERKADEVPEEDWMKAFMEDDDDLPSPLDFKSLDEDESGEESADDEEWEEDEEDEDDREEKEKDHPLFPDNDIDPFADIFSSGSGLKVVDFRGKPMVVDSNGVPLYLSKKSKIKPWGWGSFIEYEDDPFGDDARLLNSRFEPIDPPVRPAEADQFKTGGPLRVVANGYFGMVDGDGDLVVEPVFRSLSNFQEGLAIGVADDKTMLITEEFEFTEFPVKLSSFLTFDGQKVVGSVFTEKGEKWGLATIDGDILIPFDYEFVRPAGNGVYIVRKEGLFGIVDENNNIVVSPAYPGYADPVMGLVPLRSDDGNYRIFDSEKRILPETFDTGNTSIPVKVVETAWVGEGFVMLRIDEGTEYINPAFTAPGEQIIKPGN